MMRYVAVLLFLLQIGGGFCAATSNLESANSITHTFPSADGKYVLQLRETTEGAEDCTVTLIRKSDGKEIQTLHWPYARHVFACWNPDSSLVACSWNRAGYSHWQDIGIFRVNASGLHGIPLPGKFSVATLLPHRDPFYKAEAYYQDIGLGKWEDDTQLKCDVKAVFRERVAQGHITAEGNMSTEGYTTVGYTVILQCGKSSVRILSSVQKSYEKDQ
ncbi:MAG: hypothetical protein ABI615_01960 [Chthoniobacterales bacterium]